MYVIQPQFFIKLITLLRNSALSALKHKTELAPVKARNFGIANSENQLEAKTIFGKNSARASRCFQTAIDKIDKSIGYLSKTQGSFARHRPQPAATNHKAEDVGIKRLTKGNPMMVAKRAALELPGDGQREGN